MYAVYRCESEDQEEFEIVTTEKWEAARNKEGASF